MIPAARQARPIDLQWSSTVAFVPTLGFRSYANM
jgi:hypothetical protein